MLMRNVKRGNTGGGDAGTGATALRPFLLRPD
jgi:hypothetical protein